MSEPVRTVDAVVIGAGPNGLVAANLLADAGWEVLVLEAADRPGGAVSTDEFVPGFRSDRFSGFYPMAALSPVLHGLDLAGYGLRWRRSPTVLAHVLPDDRCAVISRDVEVTAASLAAFAQGDGAAWRAEFAAWSRIRDDLVAALFTPFPPVRPGLRLLRTLGAADGLRFARLATLPAGALGEERFTGEGARLLLAGNALHTDLGPGDAGGAAIGWLLSMVAQDVGFPVPEGGAGRLTRALADRFAARGGRIECGRTVTRVLIAAGRAVGVAVADGDLVRARQAVLATVPAPDLYLRLVGADRLPARLVGDLRGFRWDHGVVKVDWALSGPIPWRNPAVGGAGTVHLGTGLDDLTAYSADLAAGRVPRQPFVVLGQMTTADPTRSPAGTESAWAYTHVPHGHPWTDADRDRYADLLEQTVAHNAPGFTERIIQRRVRGPAELVRPVPGPGRADTPVDRLFLAGASAHPGSAVHGGPGANAAHAALARAGFGGSVYRAVLRRAIATGYA
ncbi:MAG TPA: NAD(P)/FAD-dependent oxidoreductase [Pseudonocardiaceae bacterium]|nr:NAD(P)/FAD-dependent oxidoreductase [Pseudonocardiaceae bacterium]